MVYCPVVLLIRHPSLLQPEVPITIMRITDEQKREGYNQEGIGSTWQLQPLGRGRHTSEEQIWGHTPTFACLCVNFNATEGENM